PGPAPRLRSATENAVGSTWSISFLAPFFGDRRVILLEQIVVLGHELLARVGVHLLTEGLGQVAPDVLVKIGDLAAALLAAAAARRGVVHLLLLLLTLGLGLVLGLALIALALPLLLITVHLGGALLLLLPAHLLDESFHILDDVALDLPGCLA